MTGQLIDLVSGGVTTNRIFPKIDHSANVARIVLAEYTIGSVFELNFC